MNDGNAWVIRNLRLYGNAVIPEKEIHKHGIRNIEEAIWRGEGLRVKIRMVDGQEERDPVSGKHVGWAEDPWYVAEIIN